MANLRENLASALRAIRENWLRSALTMLGMIIGVGSVVLLVAIGLGVKADVTRMISDFGPNIAIVVPGKLEPNGQPNFMSTMGISSLTQKDYQSLQSIKGIEIVAPIMFIWGTVESGKREESAMVVATTPSIFDVRKTKLAEGRVFGPTEMLDPICVMANDPKTRLFGSAKAVGQTVVVRGQRFKIVGVLQKEESDSLFNMASTANICYIPLDAARRLFHAGQINRFFLRTDFKQNPDTILASVQATLKANHRGKEDFGIITAKQLLGIIYKLFNIVTALLAGISAISLVVAGIGIMNIMLVTVTERTREIGIRKTVGARRTDIFVQFLTEAVVLSFAGGVIGTLLAAGLCSALSAYSPLKPLITLWAVGMAFGVCFLVGAIFGVAPAMRAARQDPIEALRYE